MRNIFKYIVSETYKPLLKKYLSANRMYVWKDIVLQIPAGIFHPGFFHSTKMLLRYLNRMPLCGKKILELGAGSGLISIATAKQGAFVTASDINAKAIEALTLNASRNEVTISLFVSDLFLNIPSQQFDTIAINPPYYKKDPAKMEDYAWYCGEDGGYFGKLFSSVGSFMHQESVVVMVLSDGCDLHMISNMAAANMLSFEKKLTRKGLIGEHFIFELRPLFYVERN